MDDGKLDALGQTIVSALPGAAISHSVAFNQLTVTVQASKIVDVAGRSIGVFRVGEDFYGIRIECFGFDSATGLPAPEDYRDVPHQLREGDFRMDEPALRARLRRSELVLGLVQDTVPRFVESAHPPLGFASIDLDYYSSTVHALQLLDASPDRLLPRVVFYFDDLHGWMYSDINGEAAAVADFNAAHEQRKIVEVRALRYDLPKSEHDLPWHEQIYIAHILDHPEYGTPERGEQHPTEHHVRLKD